MPHIIIEYTQEQEPLIGDLLFALHDSLSRHDGVSKARLKTRAMQISKCLVGDGDHNQMIHGTLLLLEGRDTALKMEYSEPLLRIMQDMAPDNCAVTLEVRDMDKDTYLG